MADEHWFWKGIERIGNSYAVTDLLIKGALIVAPFVPAVWGLIEGTPGAYLMPAVFVAVAACAVIFNQYRAWKKSHASQTAAQPAANLPTLPAYNRSFHQLVMFSHHPGRPLATLEELDSGEIEDRLVSLVDIPRDPANMSAIVGKRFHRCTIVGPGIVYPHSATMDRIGFKHPREGDAGFEEAMMWPVEDGAYKMGAIALVNCHLYDCELITIGITGPPALIDKLKEAFRRGREVGHSGPGKPQL